VRCTEHDVVVPAVIKRDATNINDSSNNGSGIKRRLKFLWTDDYILFIEINSQNLQIPPFSHSATRAIAFLIAFPHRDTNFELEEQPLESRFSLMAGLS